jgi:hypothetical protein
MRDIGVSEGMQEGFLRGPRKTLCFKCHRILLDLLSLYIEKSWGKMTFAELFCNILKHRHKYMECIAMLTGQKKLDCYVFA